VRAAVWRGRSRPRRFSQGSPSAARTPSATSTRSGHEPLATVVKQQDAAEPPTRRDLGARPCKRSCSSTSATTRRVIRRSRPITIRFGTDRLVGVHNGTIVNDNELLSGHGCARVEPRMTVDSEAVFAVAAHARNDACALEALRGSAAAAWIDEREPSRVPSACGWTAALARHQQARGLLRVDAEGTRGGRAGTLQTSLPSARSRRERWSRSRTDVSPPYSGSAPTARRREAAADGASRRGRRCLPRAPRGIRACRLDDLQGRGRPADARLE
jgi:hypothetical protein